MKMFLLLAVLAINSSARELIPSVGLSYSMLDLSAPEDRSNYFLHGYKKTDYVLDLLIPFTQWFDLNVGGGQSIMELDTLSPTFQLQAVSVGPGGGIIGTYGVSGATQKSTKLEGFSAFIKARFYFK